MHLFKIVLHLWRVVRSEQKNYAGRYLKAAATVGPGGKGDGAARRGAWAVKYNPFAGSGSVWSASWHSGGRSGGMGRPEKRHYTISAAARCVDIQSSLLDCVDIQSSLLELLQAECLSTIQCVHTGISCHQSAEDWV